MRICLYAAAALPSMGGQEMVVDALATEYVRAGHDVVVLAPRPSRRWRLRKADTPLPYRRAWHPRYFSKRRMVELYGWWLDRICRRWRCDVVHSHGIYPPGYLASLRCPRLGVPFVITSHGEDVHRGQSRMDEPRIYERHVQALAAADAMVAISRFTHEGLRRLCPTARIVDIPNGVDAAVYATPVQRPVAIPREIQENRYFLFIGRLVRQKGVDVAIEALAKSHRSGATAGSSSSVSPGCRLGTAGQAGIGTPSRHEASLVVAGDGPERENLQRLAQSLGVAGRVHFVGNVAGETKTYLLRNSRALVAPSRNWEAFGLVVLESYAAGRPVVASRLAGMADLMEDLLGEGVPGRLVAPESVEDLAAAFDALCDDSPDIDAPGDGRIEIPPRYTWPVIAQKHLELYEQVLARA